MDYASHEQLLAHVFTRVGFVDIPPCGKVLVTVPVGKSGYWPV
jgi:hypothetical protein